jgi:2-dehydro-3-deoxyphosphooctonate aldolase (KDO 8-P synthase)
MSENKYFNIGDVKIGNTFPLVMISGPCQIESRDHALMMAQSLKDLCQKYSIPLIFKASFDKANRTSISGKRGIGIESAIAIFSEIRESLKLPVITDVHLPDQCDLIAPYVDALQIPAFLCRQTDLLIAAGKTGKAINVKKGQFLAPWDMKNVIAKISATGNDKVMMCERGSSFGYNTLVNDMRALAIMATSGYPVVFDATHSTQQPGGQGSSSGGQRDFAIILARAAVSIGIAAVFAESHDNPDQAPSDGPSMIHLQDMPKFIQILSQFDIIAKRNPHSMIIQ